MTTNGFKSCPFCGSEKIQISWTFDNNCINGVYCAHCKAMVKWPVPEWRGKQTAGDYLKEWKDRWNMRSEVVPGGGNR